MSNSRLKREYLQQEVKAPSNTFSLAPPVDVAIIQHLRSVFSPKLGATLTIRDYDQQVGQQTVIQYLQSLYDQQDGG